MPVPLNSLVEDRSEGTACEPGWLFNGSNPVPRKHVVLKEHSSGYMIESTLHIQSLNEEKHRGSYQCFASEPSSSTGQCETSPTPLPVQVVVVRAPLPKIKCSDMKATEFHCRQDFPRGEGMSTKAKAAVRFTVTRADPRDGKHFPLTEEDFGRVSKVTQKTRFIIIS